MFNLFRRKEKQLPTLSGRLEKDKQKLIEDLENNGMEFLVTMMASNDEYSVWIKERRKIDLSYSTEDLVSWYAYNQSDKLTSAENKTELLEMLADDKFAPYKKYICCCLSSICSNTNDKDLFNFLVGIVQNEEDEHIKTSILSRLENVVKDNTCNLNPVKALVKEGTYNESHAAIKALSNSNDPEVEDILLGEFKITDTHMKAMICGPLSTIGTAKSIPFLEEEYKRTRDRFLRMEIEAAINKITARTKATTDMNHSARGI